MSNNPQDEQTNHRARVAGGAGHAFLGRMGALIETVSVVVFGWIYGAETFGLFAVLWAYVKVSTTVSDAAMTTALQRFVPQSKGTDAEKVAGFGIKFSFLLACLISTAISVSANDLATFINAASGDEDKLASIIRIYIWILPFWTLVEVSAGAIRARRTFGPEIRVRVFYEQGLRLLIAVILGLSGLLSYGLFIAHFTSVFLAAALALRLVAKHYDISAIIKAPMIGAIPKTMLFYGLAMIPANLVKMLFSEFPVMLLNFLLPGAAGAAAGGYYAIARKIASALQAVRRTFEYVIAPMASEKAGIGDSHALEDMYAYATRLSISIALPFGAALILARHDILAVMRPEFQAAAAAIAILCTSRVLEAAMGPSSSIVEMLGHRCLPPLNALLGLAGFLGTGVILIPTYGVTGAAISSAIGVNTTALLGFLQARFMLHTWPYDNQAVKPLCLSITASALIIGLVPLSTKWLPPTGIITAIITLFLALFVLVRFGLTAEDAASLGKLGRLLRRQTA